MTSDHEKVAWGKRGPWRREGNVGFAAQKTTIKSKIDPPRPSRSRAQETAGAHVPARRSASEAQASDPTSAPPAFGRWNKFQVSLTL